MSSNRFTATVLATALFTAVATLAAAPAMAQTYQTYPSAQGNTNTPAIDNARQAISVRVQQGLQQGRITPSEGQALMRREREIEMMEARYKSDGRATPQERDQLRAELNNLGAEVERLMARPPMVAQDNSTPGIDRGQEEIRQRIEEGARTGRISQREAQRLMRQSREIDRHEASFKSDGVITQNERRQLRSETQTLRMRVERLVNPRG